MNRFNVIEETTYGGEDDGKVEYAVIDNHTDVIQRGFDTLEQAQARARIKNKVYREVTAIVSR